ncbi:MAG: hypothetical protein P8Y44_09700 [Acidobacteriota bacterium]
MKDSSEVARALGVAVDLRLAGGESLTTGLHSWQERGGWLSIHAPRGVADRYTTRQVMFHQAYSWQLTNPPFDLY